MRLRRSVFTLLACCSVSWVIPSLSSSSPSSSGTTAPPADCDSVLAFSSETASSSDASGDIHVRSLSPWSWRSSTVTTRIPQTLWEAECSSSFCSSPGGRKGGQNLNSVPIYQSILVLNRKGRGRCYTASYRSVAVGCTCVWAMTYKDRTTST